MKHKNQGQYPRILNHVYVDFTNSKNCKNLSEVTEVSTTKSQFLKYQNFKILEFTYYGL